MRGVLLYGVLCFYTWFSIGVAYRLILTPLLKRGNIKEAQRLALTKIGNVPSYSGYFTVDEDCNSNLFFWYFPAVEPSEAILLWLNGGPGSTSAFGLFQENGPWTFSNKSGLADRQFAWTKRHDVIYLDQPVGTGFSYTEGGCYLDNLEVIALQVTEALSQFFIMFPKLRKKKLFLTGESYGGHYIPAIAVAIDKRNHDELDRINLIGLVIGNPFLDIRCINPLNLAFEMGIISRKEHDSGNQEFERFVKAIDTNNSERAEEFSDFDQSIYNSSLPDLYNVLYDEEVDEDFVEYLNRIKVQKNLHVGYRNFTPFSKIVWDTLWPNDAYVSIAPSLEYLLDSGRYIMGFYGGQLDLVCPYTSLICTLERLQWSGASDYLRATRRPWHVSGRLAGWVKVSGNLFDVAVRDAGHFVPRDQGEAALELISAAVADLPGSTLLTTLDYGSPDDGSSTRSTSFKRSIF